MSKHVLLALDKGYPELLDAHFDVIRPRAPDPERIIQEHAQDIKAIISTLTSVSRDLIESLPNLEIIAVNGVGYDHVNTAAAAERGIIVTNTPGVVTADTADTGMMLMLTIMRRGVESDAFVRAGLWKQGRSKPTGVALAGKTVGIVGLGRIGQAFASRAKAFDMDIAYFGPNEKEEFPYRYYDDLEAMATEVDVLVLTCPGGIKTRDLVNYAILKALGPKGFLVNIARGSVVNERDLLIAISNKTIAGVALDVYDNEPNVPEELFIRDNVVLLPHIGVRTKETLDKMGQIVAGNIIAHFNGEPLLTPIDL